MKQDKRSISWVVFHCLVVFLSIVSLSTGFRIAILTKPELIWFDLILPQGGIYQIHIATGVAIAVIAIIYFLQSVVSTKSQAPVSSSSVRNARYHRSVLWFGYFTFPLAIVSGLAVFFDESMFVAAFDLHFYAACSIACYFLLHSGGYFIQFGVSIFKRILIPSKTRILSQISLLILSCGLGGLWWWWFAASPSVSLRVETINLKELMDIDGQAEEEVWSRAPKLTLNTHGGANFVDGNTSVTVQAVENGVEAYFLFTWKDETKSMQHLPLVKTVQGWSVRHNGFYEFNEVEFYEDKFAVMLAESCESGAAGTAHLGSKPLADKPANWHGKGYHYAEDGKPRDVWHWKAVRTNDMFLADDNVFGSPQPARQGDRRYTAGYVPDGKESGAYVMNWAWFQESVVTPKRIPKNVEMIKSYQSDSGELSWVISWFDYEPYQSGKDNYPVGTVMPSVLYRSNRFEGDRADVRARGVWRNGVWTLELSRRLDTESDSDVRLKSDVCMWVSAFDRSQVAHTRHHQAILLKFESSDD